MGIHLLYKYSLGIHYALFRKTFSSRLSIGAKTFCLLCLKKAITVTVLDIINLQDFIYPFLDKSLQLNILWPQIWLHLYFYSQFILLNKFSHGQKRKTSGQGQKVKSKYGHKRRVSPSLC